jgi:ABC-type phosphate transport system substrate-binding protein
MTMVRTAAVAMLMLMLSGVARADVKVHGATTPMFGLLRPHKAEIERLAGVELTILPSSTLHGLADLVQGRADIAMLSEPLEVAAESLNKKEPGSINPADYISRHVGDAYVQFIVHLSNPIQKLAKAELAALLSGKTKNWSEFGGNNQPVLIVGQPTSAAYEMIQEALGITYAPNARVVQNTNQTAIIVAQAPGALSNISTAHDVPERTKFKVVETELKLQLQFYLAFRKDAPLQVKRVIDAAVLIGNP